MHQTAAMRLWDEWPESRIATGHQALKCNMHISVWTSCFKPMKLDNHSFIHSRVVMSFMHLSKYDIPHPGCVYKYVILQVEAVALGRVRILTENISVRIPCQPRERRGVQHTYVLHQVNVYLCFMITMMTTDMFVPLRHTEINISFVYIAGCATAYNSFQWEGRGFGQVHHPPSCLQGSHPTRHCQLCPLSNGEEQQTTICRCRESRYVSHNGPS